MGTAFSDGLTRCVPEGTHSIAHPAWSAPFVDAACTQGLVPADDCARQPPFAADLDGSGLVTAVYAVGGTYSGTTAYAHDGSGGCFPIKLTGSVSWTLGPGFAPDAVFARLAHTTE
jgi:hypothetical protein